MYNSLSTFIASAHFSKFESFNAPTTCLKIVPNFIKSSRSGSLKKVYIICMQNNETLITLDVNHFTSSGITMLP